jgi:predicted Zn-dependent peptidase
MAEQQFQHVLKNGMVLLGERMDDVESVAFGFLLPAGAALLPEGYCGAANVISDWIFRGAGGKNSRQLSDALDGLGLHRTGSVGTTHTVVGAALEATHLRQALGLYADVILRANLEPEQFELAKQLAVHRVRALDDDPRQKVMLQLRQQFYPPPLGRSTLGDVDELMSLSAEKTREIVGSSFNLSQTIFAVAGKFDFDALCRQMEKLFDTDNEEALEPLAVGPQPARYTHITNESAQVHIGVMTGTVPPPDKGYYNARVAVSVLSGGMSARLFTEVREKRGLCYAIGARYHGLKDVAGIMCYAGTTPDKAQETLDVIMREFNRLGDGIGEEEMHRAKVGLKSSLILHSESTSSRAGGVGSDYYLLGRVRSLDEIKDRIEQATVDSVVSFLQHHKFGDFTVVTIGPKEITVT